MRNRSPSEPDTALVAIGDRLPRREDQRLLRGAGRFIEDLQLPGEVRAAFLRSPHAHARIRTIDTSAAHTLAGVIATFIGADIASDSLGGVPWDVRPPTDAAPDALPPLGAPEVAAPNRCIAVPQPRNFPAVSVVARRAAT